MSIEPKCETQEELKQESQNLRDWFSNELKIKWNPLDHPKKEVKLYDLPTENNIYRTRCRVHCNCTYEQMLKFNMESDVVEMKKYDKSMLNYQVFDKVEGTEIIVTHTAFSITWPVVPRQFVSLHDNYDVETGHIFVQQSILNDKVEINKKYVTGYKKSGLLIERDPENKDKCYIERVLYLDPRGSIPSFVVASQKTNDAERLWEMKTYVEEKAKKGEL